MTEQTLYAMSTVAGLMAAGLITASIVSFFRGRAKLAAALSIVALLNASVTLQGLHAAKLSTYAPITPIGTDHLVLVDDPDGTPASPRLANVNELPIAASQIDSGTLTDARVAESNVTQHEAALTLTKSQVSDLATSNFVTTGSVQGIDVLSVNSTDAYIRLLSDSDNNSADQDGQIQFYIDGATPGAATLKGILAYDQSADVFRMGYGGSVTDITIDSSNNVGIGQVPGTDKLEVTGDMTVTGEITANSYMSTAAFEAIRLVAANNTDGYVDVVGDADANSADNDSQLRFFTDGRVGVGTQKGTLGYDQSIDVIRLSYGDSTTQFVIDPNGNIGAGDSTPDAQFDVQADSASEVVGLFQMAAAASANAVEVKDSGGTNELIVSEDGELASTPDSVTLAMSETSFAATSNVMTVTGHFMSNTVATITDGEAGQVLTLLFVDAQVTVTDDDGHTANTVDLSAAFTSADDTTLTLMFDGTSWYEISRSAN